MKNKIVIHGSQYKDNFGDTLLVRVIQHYLYDKLDIYSSTGSEKVCRDLQIKKASKLDLIFSEFFIYGGGGYFGEPNKNILRWSIRFIFRHGLVGILRRLFRRKYIFIGTGLGPLSNPLASLCAKFVLNGADMVNLRDKESVKYAEKLTSKVNIYETADLVPGYISSNYQRKDEKKLVLHLHIPTGDYEKLNRILNGFIKFRDIYLKEYSIEIISDSENDEQQTWFFEQIKCKNPEIKILEYRNFEETIEILKCASFVVTNKLHVAIVSASMKIPVASIFMHNKTMRFFEQLNRPDSAMPLDSINDCLLLEDFFIKAYESGIDVDALDKIIKLSNKNLVQLGKWILNE